MKVLYLHGLGSSGNSRSAKLLKSRLESLGCTCDTPDVKVNPEEARDQILELNKQNQYDIVIGISLGGFYASMVSGNHKILINPAINPNKCIMGHWGLDSFEFYSPRQDPTEKIMILDKFFYDSLQYIYRYWDKFYYDNETNYESKVFIGEDDDIIDRKAIRKYFTDIKYVKCGHRMNEEMLEEVINRVKEIIDGKD